ncbi:proton-coupled amino acid transporter 1-like isoform X2 [Cherax quadricarinatus]|uniref:proton-coupled amino acid transporter 1-like isoform X2 n=1 Tax=Cherax quadricarinatus TaxID=27406 RepID=UPI00387E6ADC
MSQNVSVPGQKLVMPVKEPLEAGIMEGALIMAVVGYLSVAAMLMLIDCKYAILTSGGRAGGRSIIMDTKVPLIPPDSSDDEDEDERHPPTPSTDLTYGDVGLYALGSGGKRLVDIAVVVSQVGFCCGYLIYLCKNLSIYLPRFSQRLWLMLLLPPLYCLTLLRHLNKLAIFSLFAQVSNVLALTVVFWFDFSHSEEVPFTPKEFSIKGFPFFFAVAIYCYEGAGMILSLEESMAEHKRDKFRSTFVCTMTGLTMLYICFGVSGYASFGPHTMDIITLNLPHGSGTVDFAAMVKICLGVSLFFTYPLMMFPVTHLLDKTFGFATVPYRGNIMRLILVIMTGMVVSAVPNFAILMSLIGATCCTLLAFILPAAFHLAIFKQLYKQTYGMRMGSPIGAVLANLYMEHLESEHFANIIPSSITWLRYVDNVLVITPKRFDVQNLQARLNADELAIQFTLEEESNDKLPFLDVLIHSVDNSLRFHVYQKPTNKNDLTHFYSSQDTKTKRGIIIRFFLRAYRICSPEFLDKECTYIHRTFTDLHFPSFFIKDCKKRALQIINSPCTNITPNKVIILPNSQVALNVSKVLSQANTRVAIASSTSIKDLTKQNPSTKNQSTQGFTLYPVEAATRFM